VAGSNQNAQLEAISCPATGSCVAVGWYEASDGSGNVAKAVTETLSDGAWSAAAAPGLTAGQGGTASLVGVACPAEGNYVAVGDRTSSQGVSIPEIETLSGGTWTTAKAPLPGDAATSGQLASLWAITCQAPGNCLAGGHYVSQHGQPGYLAETLAGGAWTAAAAPLPADAAADQKWSKEQATSLGGVACLAAGSCVASATYVARSGAIAPAIDTLSGGTWTVANAPLPGGAAQGTKQIGYLTLVACPASGSCLTVGSYTAGGGGTQGLIETAVASR
jgi:hypothetical protein